MNKRLVYRPPCEFHIVENLWDLEQLKVFHHIYPRASVASEGQPVNKIELSSQIAEMCCSVLGNSIPSRGQDRREMPHRESLEAVIGGSA